ncbi:MAG TPA: hypothetical protein VF234_06185 [Limnochordia bacterium]
MRREICGVPVIALEPVVRGSGPPRLWRARLADGREVALKHGTPAEAARWLALFEGGGLDVVPPLLQCDPEGGWIVTDWIAGVPLDDWLQGDEQPAGRREQVARRLNEAITALERAFPALPADAVVGEDAPVDALASRAAAALAWFAGGAALVDAAWERGWSRVRQAARDAPRLGPLDCNAQNVLVLPDGDIRIVDLSAAGEGSAAARRVRYATATGAYRPGGRFATLLDARTVAALAADGREGTVALDAWDLIMFGLAAAQLVVLLRGGDHPSVAALRAAWGDPGRRAAQLGALIGRPVSDEPRLRELRKVLAERLAQAAPGSD